jgi:hypothetical protein
LDIFDENVTENPEDGRCAFCGDCEDIESNFNGPHPFIFKAGAVSHNFWCHVNCALHSPEVSRSESGQWYNVANALKRGKQLNCIQCGSPGATIGCFKTKCFRNYHFKCTGKPLEHFEQGKIFWCPFHEGRFHVYLGIINRMDDYYDSYSCDSCGTNLKKEWMTCNVCSNYFSTYDLCEECFKCRFSHSHSQSEFEKTCAI